MVAGDIDPQIPSVIACSARSGHDHRDSGNPLSRGGVQAIALTRATWTAVNFGRRPDRFASASDAALLSATPKKERAKGATGGLLRRIGERGVMVVKDVTTILSMDRNMRGEVLAALREVYDGRWYAQGRQWRAHPDLARADRRHRRGDHRLGHPPRRRRHDGRPVRAAADRTRPPSAGSRAAGHRQYRLRDRDARRAGEGRRRRDRRA